MEGMIAIMIAMDKLSHTANGTEMKETGKSDFDWTESTSASKDKVVIVSHGEKVCNGATATMSKGVDTEFVMLESNGKRDDVE